MVEIKDIIKSDNINKLFFVFFNLGSKQDDGFEIRISYRRSSKSDLELGQDLVEENNKLLRSFTGLPFELVGKHSHGLSIKNNRGLTRDEILLQIYSRTQQLRFKYAKSDYEESMLLSFFIPRGSMDLSRNLYAVDILNHNISQDYVSNLMSLLSSTSGIRQLNLNFRQLQPEYINENKRRNTQLRINLTWLYDNYIDQIKEINKYKYLILEDNRDLIQMKNIGNNLSNGFIERALFYKDSIVGNEDKFGDLSDKGQKAEIKRLRKELNFDDPDRSKDDMGRNTDLVKLAIISQEDECVCCRDLYDIWDRTFARASNGKPYLEIHHVISFGSDKDSDVIENLVKVCPACHRALTPNRARESYQRELIRNILKNSPAANNYIGNFVSKEAGLEGKIDYIYSKLK